MLASRRSWWRIAENLDAGLDAGLDVGSGGQARRPVIPTKNPTAACGATARSGSRPAPVVAASRPGQAWSWDITDLLTPWRGTVLKAYKITDIYSREIIGHRVEHREADHLAAEMFETAIAAHGAPEVVHADSGAAMRSNLVRETLTEPHQVRLSFNRPYVSNDNPFSEAGFRTMKYRPDYPRAFETLEAARVYVDDYVAWYNAEHKHSGIALFSPAQVADGTWRQAWKRRDEALQRYYDTHPERFRHRPSTPAPAEIVGINLPENELRPETAG